MISPAISEEYLDIEPPDAVLTDEGLAALAELLIMAALHEEELALEQEKATHS